MTYAQQRRVIDADSHLMEWPSFLTEHAPASVADRLPAITGGLSGLDVEAGRHAASERAELIALGDDLLRRGPKWHAALGAVERSDRATALDLLGFESQVVYSSLSWGLYNIEDPELRYPAYRAHNEAMAAFCAADARLSGVGLCDLDDPERSLEQLRLAIDLGLGQIAIPARAPGGGSPGHQRNDGFWRELADRCVPFVLHVGAAPISIESEWMDDGSREGSGPRQPQAEVIGSKDLMVIYQPFERFLSMLILDGVVERFPDLRGGAIEVGAGWVPEMLRRLDHAMAIWSRSELRLSEFNRQPSEQAIAQLRFTPYAFEDVGNMIDQ
ncbi:MAG: amidohydrolase family protein, partial [Actinomycetota bacterium]|nr:amidohydrolase family protein [Actinomycetota bacterium]